MPQSLPHAGADKSHQFLSVRIGDQEFALSITAIREIRRWTAATALPHAPSDIKGMIDLRGSVLTIVDLAKRLGLPGQEPHAASVVVVVEAAGRVAGLLVEAVCDILTVTAAMRQAVPEAGAPASREVIEDLIMMNDRIISILSIPALMPDERVLEATLDAA